MPIDLHTLQLVRLIAKHRNFSKAAIEASLSQSALSRQIANLESRLGLKVFERSTRKVIITEAGAILLRETAAIPNLLETALKRIREECLNSPVKIRVALSSEISLAHIPGILSKNPADAQIVVNQEKPDHLISNLSRAEYDLGIFARPPLLPDEVAITHTMMDRFTLISNSDAEPRNSIAEWPRHQWILPPSGSPARELLNQFHPDLKASMEIENFDLIIHLVALGLGQAFVPRRSLASFARKHQIRKHHFAPKIERVLVVAVPKYLKPNEHVEAFIRSILFS